MNQMIDMTGQRYGRLVVIRRIPAPPRNRKKHTWWLCQCDCGEVSEVPRCSLVSGATRSCGCLSREATAERNRRRVKR